MLSVLALKSEEGHLSGSVVECLPSTPVMIPGSWDRVPHQAPCREPASPPAYVSASLCVSPFECFLVYVFTILVGMGPPVQR